MGDSIFWVPTGILTLYHSQQYKKVAPKLDASACYAVMAGIIFPIFMINSVRESIDDISFNNICTLVAAAFLDDFRRGNAHLNIKL